MLIGNKNCVCPASNASILDSDSTAQRASILSSHSTGLRRSSCSKIACVAFVMSEVTPYSLGYQLNDSISVRWIGVNLYYLSKASITEGLLMQEGGAMSIARHQRCLLPDKHGQVHAALCYQ